jgi:hypothetical protein
MAGSPNTTYALSDGRLSRPSARCKPTRPCAVADPDGEPGPCSYCAKTNKTCTFDWVRAQTAQGRVRRPSTNSVRSSTRPAASSVQPDPNLFAFAFDVGDLSASYKDSASLSSSSLSQDLAFFGLPSPPGWLEPDQPAASGPGETPMLGLETETCESMGDPALYAGVFSTRLYPTGLGWGDMAGNSTHNVPSATNAFAVEHQEFGVVGLAGPDTEASRRLERLHRRRRRYQRISVAAPLREVQHSLNTGTNHAMISDSLMQIYHDVLEGALSCWLTEQTCPYKMNAAGGEQCPPLEPITQEWGSSWSNRILRRVVKLDAVVDPVPQTPTQRQAGTRALQLAILAFSTQWAQGGDSHRELGVFPAADFDRLIQKSFWHQARRALDECRDSDSFTVAYAEVIFGLTQKFSDDEDGLGTAAHDSEVDALGLVNAMLKKDTAYVYLERATRRLHVLKRLVESRERRGLPTVNPEDGKTIGMVYWLAMMFDTISSAMTERPLSVSDEEGWEMMLLDDRTAPTVWEFSARLYDAPLRWPCSEADAARLLVEAAPVKVLLFRKVAHIQTLVFGTAAARVRDEAMRDALHVLQHWNRSYGPLFQDLIDHHTSLPPRIQSWYVCLLGHWLLGVLLLADLMDLASSCGTYCGTPARDLAAADQLRWTSVRTISALAEASMPLGDRTLHLFHSSVGESALLTEPWTAVLIRTFSYAAALVLDMGQRETLGLCELCIGALWHLGRKSDLSRQMASMLGQRLQSAKAQSGY